MARISRMDGARTRGARIWKVHRSGPVLPPTASFQPGNKGHTKQRGRKRARARPAPATGAWVVSPQALDVCARRLRELFPGSCTRARLDEMWECVAATTAVVAIEWYLRVARYANQAVDVPKIDAISYRFCTEADWPAVTPLDDVEAHLLALRYCAIAAQFLQDLLPAPANVSACLFVALVAFLYLQCQGVQAKTCVLVDRDALLAMLLPADSCIDKFGIF